MNKPFSFSFLFFTCFLVIGYSVSTVVYRADDEASTAISKGMKPEVDAIQALDNGQRSILLIGVDAIHNSNPKLTSLWLATYLPPDMNIHLLPIFPAGNKTISEAEIHLYRSFGLSRENGNLVPGEEFLKVLEENNYWWSGYFVFDQFAQSKVLSFLSGDEASSSETDGLTGTGGSVDVVDDHQKAFTDQLAMIQSVCQNMAGFSQDPDWLLISSLIPDHVLTDLNIHQLNSEWETTLSNGRHTSCRFPTLQVTRVDQ